MNTLSVTDYYHGILPKALTVYHKNIYMLGSFLSIPSLCSEPDVATFVQIAFNSEALLLSVCKQ